MRVGVVDVGANTARLLVAQVGARGLIKVHEARTPIALGAEIEERGKVAKRKRAEVAVAVREAVAQARGHGAQQVEVVVTSPGRQCENPRAFEAALASAAGAPVRLLGAEEEARLAFVGAVAVTAAPDGVSLAVCDVGGGSAQLAVGPAAHGPVWLASIDLGSLRLTRRHLESDPPARRELRAARATVRDALAGLGPPPARAALATGGTARALRKVVGATLGPDELDRALSILARCEAREIAARFSVPEWRARLLPAGALILTELQRSIGRPLVVARGGVREGAAVEIRDRAAAAA
jgi:exopolyphosphatase/guanosine-5'-triphosphate,3'-diphosphate pyrophosphatase